MTTADAMAGGKLARGPQARSRSTGLQDYTFHNVVVTVRARSGREAYTILCEDLQAHDFLTNTYSTDGDPTHGRDTMELYPENVHGG